ncbi:MAG: CARDB domain-containing protein, partial [Saprospiraceae bacterium]
HLKINIMKNLKSFLSLFSLLFLSINMVQAQPASDIIRPTAPANRKAKLASLPDLIVTSANLIRTTDSNRVYYGNEITVPVLVTIKNIGKGNIPARRSFYVFVGGGGRSAFITVSNSRGIRAGQTVTLRSEIKLSAAYSGKSTVFDIVADRDRTSDDVYTDSIQETNERNNNFRTRLNIPKFTKRLTLDERRKQRPNVVDHRKNKRTNVVDHRN